MNDKRTDIMQTWRERFGDSRNWMTEVFSRIYTDDDSLAIEVGGKVVSSLLLRGFMLNFKGEIIPVGYIYGAATMRSQQGKGYMSKLMVNAIRESRNRGQIVAMLHPARRRLYGFYAKFGFTTALFIDEKRFTSVHKFVHDESRYIIEDSIFDYAELADAYARLSSSRGACVLHDASDFRTILIDNDLDHGLVSIVRYAETGSIAAIAIAKPNRHYGSIGVRELVADDEDAANAALSQFTAACPGMMTVVESYPEREHVRYAARGMARIVNVEGLFKVISAIRPKTHMTIKVDDPLIRENHGVFKVDDGKVMRLNNDYNGKIDLDVSIEVLTSIMFSSERIGDLFDLPTGRLFASLMLT